MTVFSTPAPALATLAALRAQLPRCRGTSMRFLPRGLAGARAAASLAAFAGPRQATRLPFVAAQASSSSAHAHAAAAAAAGGGRWQRRDGRGHGGGSGGGWFAGLSAGAGAAAAAAAAAAGGCAVCEEAGEADGEKLEIEMDPGWKQMIERVSPAIVSIIVNVTRDFDHEKAGSSQATGFVVDAERGILLTNKHVVHDGPVVARAIFNNHEEVALTPIFRDPIHDFGFFQFDPAKLRYSRRVELPLRPDLARVGTEIRVAGNNAGERFSIHAGTLARLDREAPNTGVGADHNTFYLQAASGTSGGSSGSPVLDKGGNVVALNAAGKMLTNVSLFLPLERVAEALHRIREGEPVRRGTVAAVFKHQPYEELSRLGLSAAEQRDLRAQRPGGTGLLTVSEVIKGGPAHGALKAGDIVLAVDGAALDTFVELEDVLDRSVGAGVVFTVARGEQRHRLELRVEDLRAAVPSAFLECGECIFNDVSLQTARQYNLPVGGAFVAKAGYMLMSAGIRSGCVVTQVNNDAVRNIGDLAAAFAKIPDGADVAVRVYNVANPYNEATALVRFDRRWYPMQLASRDDEWRITPVPVPVGASGGRRPGKGRGGRALPFKDAKTGAIAPSLVGVRTTVPYGHLPVGSSFVGTGLVVDADKGLVVADRLTVPTALSDCELNFGDSMKVPAEVVFIHPVFNIAVCRYDPAAVGDTPVRSATLASERAIQGDKVVLTGVTNSGRAGIAVKSFPTRVGYDQLASSHGMATNMDALSISPAPTQDGVIHDDDGRVVGMFASFGVGAQSRERGGRDAFLGIPADKIAEIVEPLRRGVMPQYKTLGCRLEYVALSQLRALGLPEATARGIEERADAAFRPRQAVVVSHRWAGTGPDEQLRDGDVVLSVNGRDVGTIGELDAALNASSDGEAVRVHLFRPGEMRLLDVTVGVFDATEGNPLPLDRLVLWAGSALCSTPSLVRWLWRCPAGVYVSGVAQGSPARHHRLAPGSVIVSVDEIDTPNLDVFLDVVRRKGRNQSLRVRTVSMRGKEAVTTVTTDDVWWPTHDVSRLADGQWRRTSISPQADAAAASASKL